MGTYKGNVGNLMQHWTLCEVLKVAQNNGVTALNYVDAHAMAPWATGCPNPDRIFTSAKKLLPGQKSEYEKAWHSLVQQNNPDGQQDGYPSSAAFVREVWDGPYSLLLCERNSTTAGEIATWLTNTGKAPKRAEDGPFRGDWRERFGKGLLNPCDMDLPKGSLTLISFDPNLYSVHTFDKSAKGKPKLYREDLVTTLNALCVSALTNEDPVIIQLSTYSTNGSNPQEAVITSADGVLNGCGFRLVATVRPLTRRGTPSKSMMSLIYVRGVSWANELADLPHNFQKWLREIPSDSSATDA